MMGTWLQAESVECPECDGGRDESGYCKACGCTGSQPADPHLYLTENGWELRGKKYYHGLAGSLRLAEALGFQRRMENS